MSGATGTDTLTLPFLRAVFGGADAGLLEVLGFTHDNGGGVRFSEAHPVADLETVASAIGRCAQRWSTYVTACTHSLASDEHRTNENAKQCCSLVEDIDTRDGVHAAADNTLPTKEEARALLEGLPLNPSVILDTGGGLQAWWILREPLDLTDSSERTLAVGLRKGWHNVVERSLREMNPAYHLDNVTDLAHVFRVPGTLNRKSNPPRPVVVLESSELRYNPADLIEYTGAVNPDDSNGTSKPRADFSPVKVAPMLEGCAWLRHCRDDRATLPQPEWYLMLGQLGCVEGGEELAHEWSTGYARNGHEYTHGETARTFARAASHPPATCRTIAGHSGGRWCETCPARVDRRPPVKSPVNLATPMKTEASATGTENGKSDTWPPRQSLPAAEPVPSLPAELVPQPLRPWIEDHAERASIPLEMVAAPAVVVAGAVVGRSVGIRPEGGRNGWTVVPNLWGGIVAQPGLLKSAALGEAVAPLRTLEAEAREVYRLAAQEAEVDKAALTAELTRLKSRRAGEVDRGAIGQVMKELRECEPAEKRYSTQDATVEKLGEILVDNPYGILLWRDELAGWIAGFDRSGREGERAFYLEAWNGTGAFTVDRIERGTIHIPALCVSVLGTIQPGRLSSYVGEALAGGGGADGLLQRLQVVVWPDGLPAYKRTTGTPDHMARERAFAVYRALDNLKAEQLGAALVGAGGVPCLAFNAEAQALFDAWRDELEARLRGEELQRTPAFCSHLAKYRSLMPSLALLFHLIKVVAGHASGTGDIPVETARLAAAWCDYLEAHARKVYRRELVADIEGARLLAAKIESGDVRDGQMVRDLYRPQWTGLRTPDLVWQALAALERLGWLRLAELTTGGRPAYAVKLHPDLGGGGR